MPQIALATCAHHPGFIANDDQPLLDALHRRGAKAELARWDDEAIEWAAFDAVVIRTTWDYQEKLEAYLAWVDRVEACTTLLNPAKVIRANIRKTYLRNLERAGVPIVPTRWLEPGGDAGEAVRGLPGDVVVKPSIGAGASGLLKLNAADIDTIRTHAATLPGVAMIQPFAPTIFERGELSVVFIGDRMTHAVRKVPAPGDFRVQIEFGGVYTVTSPTQREAEVARRAVHALAPTGTTLAYARVDLIEPVPGSPAVSEVELIEPELFLPLVPSAADELADRVLNEIQK